MGYYPNFTAQYKKLEALSRCSVELRDYTSQNKFVSRLNQRCINSKNSLSLKALAT